MFRFNSGTLDLKHTKICVLVSDASHVITLFNELLVISMGDSSVEIS